MQKKNKQNIGTIIECRMNSSRLPGKVLLPILGKPALYHLIKRLKNVNPKHEIILATTTNKKDDKIIKFAKKFNIKYFRGSELNVFKRVIDTAKKFKLDIINSVCGDCMLLDPKLVSEALKKFILLQKNNIDILTYDMLPHGFDCTIVNAKSLIKSYKFSKSAYDRDNPTFALRKNPHIFRKYRLIAKKKLQNNSLSLALDYWEDYLLINIIYENLYLKKKNFNLQDILNFFKKNPDLKNLNKHLRRNFYPEISWWKKKRNES